MKLSGSLAWLAFYATSAATATDFSKEKAGIDAVAKQAKANLFERLNQHNHRPQGAPGAYSPKAPPGSGGGLGSGETTCTADKLVYRKE